MLRFLVKNLQQIRLKTCKRYKSENVIGGGLEKLQGGLKEEKYFSEQNHNLMAKIRDQSVEFKSESSTTDLNQFEKALEASDKRTALRETCSLNKHKNCLEEAFFLNEQNECCVKLSKKGEANKEITKEAMYPERE